jgi:hypothetical protein
VEQCNVGDYAKKHVAAHAEIFGKAFPLLPCNTLQEIEALNDVLGCKTTAVSAVCIWMNGPGYFFSFSLFFLIIGLPLVAEVQIGHTSQQIYEVDFPGFCL